MGFRIVRVSGELISFLFVEGEKFPGDGRVFEVTKGLPKGATLVGSSLDFATNELLLKFAHESWPDQPGCPIPEIQVLYSSWTIPLQPIKDHWQAKQEELNPVVVRS